MKPTKREFVAQAGQHRKEIEALRATNSAILEELKKSGREEMEIEGRKVSARRATAILKKLDELGPKLDDLQRTALDAHTQKDRVAWPKHAERLSWIEEEIQKMKPPDRRPPITEMPTPLLKILVSVQELQKRAELVQRHAQALAARGELDDWMGELTGIMDLLKAANDKVNAIDDGTPSHQSFAQILKILENVRALDTRIGDLGGHLRRVSAAANGKAGN